VKDIIDRLDAPTLRHIIETICEQMCLTLDTDNDPGTNNPCVFASHPVIGTFTCADIASLPIRAYLVECVSTEQVLLKFKVVAETKQHAIDMCAQRIDMLGQSIEPISSTPLETTDESSWKAELA